MTWIFWALVTALLVYEIVALLNQREGDTISEIVWRASLRRPVVPFVAGFLAGHLFW